MQKMRILFLVSFLSLSFSLFSQDLILNYTEPMDLVVCDSNDFTFMMTNASPDTLFNIKVTVATPTGLEYVAGSVTAGTEFNISVANAPVFVHDFIPPFASVEFTITTQLKCALVESINAAALFSNTISATWDGGNNSVTTDPYDIETPLLVITAVTNTFTSGTQGEIITRTITIQNTRLGALSSFIFSDNHNGGISITSNLGTVISSTATSFEIELNGSDFMTLGDGDDFFEKDEVIVITEQVEITDCGVDILFTNSTYEVSWGCYGESCQEATQNALINIYPSPENPELTFDAFMTRSPDYCADIPGQQGLTIRNVGIYEAINVQVELGWFGQGNDIGMDANSFVQDSNGVVEAIMPSDLSLPVPTVDCSFPPNIFTQSELFWATIPAGDSITVTWDYYHCRDPERCGSDIAGLDYDYQYIKNCPADTVIGYGSAFVERDELLRDTSVHYYFGQPLVDGNGLTDSIYYGLNSSQLLGSGTLNISFTLPCGFSWGNSDLMMGGELPTNVDITNVGNETIVVATYNLPLDDSYVETYFNLNFECDPSCGSELGDCLEPYITEDGEVRCGSVEEIEILATLQEDPSISLECSMQTCETIPLMVDCDLNDFVISETPTPNMPIPNSDSTEFAQLFFSTQFQRHNFDLPDNNDDRLADATGDLDFNLVRKDRTIPGDTVTNIFRGKISFPNNAFPLDVDLMTVQFEQHSVDGAGGGGITDIGEGIFTSEAIKAISAVIRIFDSSTGTYFECEIGDPMLVDTNNDDGLEIVNTGPPDLIDLISYSQFKYNTSLANISCLPMGFEYEEGDSIIFTTQHKMVYNPISDIGELSPILNLRASIVPIRCDFFNPYISYIPTLHSKFQHSGYKYEVLSGTYSVLPCEPFDDGGGIGLRFVLGMDNFFPYEYRPLSSLKKWKIKFTSAVNVLESKLAYLRYQGGSTIFENENIVFSTNNDTLSFEVEQWHIPTLDEGWEMSFYHKFESVCNTSIDSSTFVFEMELNPQLPESSSLVYDTTMIHNTGDPYDSTFVSTIPIINAAINVANYTGFDDQASWNLLLINGSNDIALPAENVWMQPVSSTGLMTNFQLINNTTGQVVPQTNGIFQIGTMIVGQLFNFELSAINNSCQTEVIQLHYGWDCEPYISPNQTPCDENIVILTATSPNGELEMDVMSPVGLFNLCEEIDYHTVEIYNAQLGNVFDILLEATLPLGLELVAGSSQIAYPTGGGFVDIPDPTIVVGNVYQWDISSLNNLIQTSGLLGVSQTPDHSVSIRFLTDTDCGFIAGAQIIFNVIGKQNCNIPTNTLSKVGDAINIAGVNSSYTTDVNIAIANSNTITCGSNVALSINVLPDGITSDSDSILITLPVGVSYVAGSYIPINNASTNPPIVLNNGGQQILKIKIDAGIAANSLISFEIETTGYGSAGCGDQVVQVVAVQRQNATCAATGELCYVLAATGSGTISIVSEHPELTLQSLEITPSLNVISYDLTIGNVGIASSESIQIDFYMDNDADGMLSAGDVLVGTGTYTGIINTNETVVFSGVFSFSSDQLCSLIAVIDEDNNCVCATEVIGVNASINATLADQAVCSGEEIELGIPAVAGHTYQWNPPTNITTTNNSTTIFQAPSTTTNTLFFNFTMTDNDGNNCEIIYSQEVAVLPMLGNNQQDIEICAGETITISATLGGDYTWEGPNISNPNQQNQTVTLFENTSYTVTINSGGDCQGMDEFNINVLPFEEGFSMVEKCSEDVIQVGGQMITEAGMYCDTIPNVVGCDSLICVEVVNYVSSTENIYELCEGDSVEINGEIYFSAETICNTSVSFFGCDSTHCVTIEMLDEPFAEVVGGVGNEIFIAKGVETQLQVTEGFATYEWFPTTGLSCTDCPNPTTTLDESLEYKITVTDDWGCSIQLLLLVTILPPCDAQRLQIPNVFTPDGDGVNDVFGVVPYEGFEQVLLVTIFNRWGEKIYQATGEDAYWDGTVNGGKRATSDVYVYMIRILCGDGGVEILHGDVTLIR